MEGDEPKVTWKNFLVVAAIVFVTAAVIATIAAPYLGQYAK